MVKNGVRSFTEKGTQRTLFWAAYHANRQLTERVLSHLAPLPLFTETANTAATIIHTMKVVAMATQHLYSGQIPIITMDQPLFCLAEQIQKAWPEIVGED